MPPKKTTLDPRVDDPFAHEKKRNWGFFQRRRMRKARDFKEKMRAEEAYADLRLREMELATMETEEKLGWDVYELPVRNRHRMIVEHESRAREEKARAKEKAQEESKQKEEGFTAFNGTIQEFSRWRDSPAMFHSFAGHTGAVLSFRISSDFNYIVSCGADLSIKMWDVKSHKCVRTFEGHSKSVFDCDVVATFTKENPMGGRIVSAAADKTIRIWDAVYATCRKVIRGHTDVVYACSFTPDGEPALGWFSILLSRC